MYRKLKSELLGINFSSIPQEKVKIEGACFEGDIIENEDGLCLICMSGGICLMTNDPMDYIEQEDLEKPFYKIGEAPKER